MKTLLLSIVLSAAYAWFNLLPAQNLPSNSLASAESLSVSGYYVAVGPAINVTLNNKPVNLSVGISHKEKGSLHFNITDTDYRKARIFLVFEKRAIATKTFDPATGINDLDLGQFLENKAKPGGRLFVEFMPSEINTAKGKSEGVFVNIPLY